MIELRHYDASDREAFLSLYRECLSHYRVPTATKEEEGRILDLLASRRHMSCLLAYDDAQPVGFATWVLTLPAGTGIALYMKEIFVSRRARGKGVGRALLTGLLDIADAENCARFDWQTDGENLEAQKFYASIDAPVKGKRVFRVMATEFDRFRSRLR